MIYPLKLLKFKLYVKCFLTNLIWFGAFRKENYFAPDKCKLCGKELIKRRIEINIVYPEYDYESEFDEFLCLDCAIKYLYNFRRIRG